jgi:integrase/recombinase XerD
MNMRFAGHDVSIIALWLGHQDVSSTMKYLHADLKLKERALDRTAAAEYQLGRYQPSDTVLDFLDSLTTPARK